MKIERRGGVVVEVLATEEEARGTYTLTHWDAERKRDVVQCLASPGRLPTVA